MYQFKYIKLNLFSFIVSYLIIILIFSIASYKYFINDFAKLEKSKNINDIHTVLNAINTNIKQHEHIINEYSKWDETYDFIDSFNPNYLYDNFREGTTTLEDLDIDFILYSNLNQESVFSKYNNNLLEKNKVGFEHHILKEVNQKNKIIKYKSHTLYLIKSTILKSDETGKEKGYIYIGKVFKNKELKEISKVFSEINMADKHVKTHTLNIQLTHVKNIKVKVELTYQYILNNIQIYDIQNNYIFSIITKNERNIVNNGEKTILTFNLIISIFLFVIYYFIYKKQNILQKYNKILELKVSRRTQQLTTTLRKLKGKNKELYTLANMDSLTKIRNRRNYFIESEKALQKSILENTELSILMIDIDHFKKINDTYGHAVGDKVLIEFCTIINRLLDENSIFGRIGGEEFCITFVNKSLQEATKKAELIRNTCEHTIITVENNNIKFTVSLGLSRRDKFKNVDEILQVSDQLLYKAKKSGRNRLIRMSVH